MNGIKMVKLSTPNPSFPVHVDSFSSEIEPSKPVLNLKRKSTVSPAQGLRSKVPSPSSVKLFQP